MSRAALFLFDDTQARDWRPFTLTRPAGELLYGTRTLRRRAELALRLECAGHVSSRSLVDYDEPWASPVVQPESLPRDVDTVFLLSRFVAEPHDIPDGALVLTRAGSVVGARVPAGADLPGPAFFDDPDSHAPDGRRHELPGTALTHVWDLVVGNAERTTRDLADAVDASLPAHVDRLGAGAVVLGRDVQLAPGVVLDTRSGPIQLDDGVRVEPFTHVAGPAYIGSDSTLLGGPIHGASIGPRCKVHGEIEETVILGYANKAHDGFLGHAYLGMWVNLGALTTNSDLKNNYGSVRLWTAGAGPVDTGLSKLGCFIGDHVKTAIGTLLNTGSVIETASNIFGGMPPTYVPPFTWGSPGTAYELEPFLATARTVMERRDVAMSPGQQRLLETAWRETRG